MKRIFLYGVLVLLASCEAFAQGGMQMSASKHQYGYGEAIEFTMRVWNDSTSTFVLDLSGTPFPYWSLDSVSFSYVVLYDDQRLTFAPGDSKTWVWRILPSELGVPNSDESHIVTGVCGRFTDTMTFEAPMYRGGPVGVEFYSTVPPEDRTRLRDSLHAVLTMTWSDSDLTFEKWQVDGFQIDSLANAMKSDSRVSNAWVSRSFPFPSDFIETAMTDADPLPGGLRLDPNFPNPFNPMTTIAFILPSEGWAQLKVFDVAGRELRTLLAEHLDSGAYSVAFWAEGVASGVYYYMLTFDGRTICRPMLLLR
jgi:hypothetical protein